jgi:hypothetical protein
MGLIMRTEKQTGKEIDQTVEGECGQDGKPGSLNYRGTMKVRQKKRIDVVRETAMRGYDKN